MHPAQNQHIRRRLQIAAHSHELAVGQEHTAAQPLHSGRWGDWCRMTITKCAVLAASLLT